MQKMAESQTPDALMFAADIATAAINLLLRPLLAAAQDRWSADHSDAFERLKQAWTSAEAALQ